MLEGLERPRDQEHQTELLLSGLRRQKFFAELVYVRRLQGAYLVLIEVSFDEFVLSG